MLRQKLPSWRTLIVVFSLALNIFGILLYTRGTLKVTKVLEQNAADRQYLLRSISAEEQEYYEKIKEGD